jgi:hypothetical protein
MVDARRARAIGFSHLAPEVRDIEEALTFQDRLFGSAPARDPGPEI